MNVRSLVLVVLAVSGCGGPPTAPCGRPANTDATEGPLSPGTNLRTFEGQRYAVHVSDGAFADPMGAEVIVGVHGFNGTLDDCQGKAVVWSQLETWRPLADERGWVVVAPQFDETRFDWFQALNLMRVAEYGPRADHRLHAILDRTAELLPGLDVEQFGLVGFSAGGQFAHRYALLHPERLWGLVAGGPGSWAFADSDVAFPYGTGNLDPLRPELAGWCSPDALFWVGELDDGSDPYFSGCDETWTDLCEQQGTSRTERAVRFHETLLGEASRQGIACSPGFEVLEGIGHETPPDVDRWIADFLAARSP